MTGPETFATLAHLGAPLAAADGQPLAEGLLTVFSMAVLVYGLCRVRGTTLVAPLAWAIVSVAALGGVELAASIAGGPAKSSWYVAGRFAATMASFCPLMALLGAKRPQNRAWVWVVLTLWVVLALPALRALLMGEGERLLVHDASRWFMLGLIALGPANYLPTRHAISGLLVGAAQFLLLRDYLPRPFAGAAVPDGAYLGTVLFAVLLAMRSQWRAGTTASRDNRSPLDRSWIEFRNRYGAVWGLRVAERFNAAARAGGWPIALTWYGLTNSDRTAPVRLEDLPEETAEAARRNLRSLLSRFVGSQGLEGSEGLENRGWGLGKRKRT